MNPQEDHQDDKKGRVEHHRYVDYADFSSSETTARAVVDVIPGPQDSFPVRLHYFLGKVDEEGLANVVSWQPHGRAFKVRNRVCRLCIIIKGVLICLFVCCLGDGV